jgi:hypothetical protein
VASASRKGTVSNPKVLARIALGKKRLQSVLSTHTVAMARTLEQKISDAGPSGQRVDPIYLTKALQQLRDEGRVVVKQAEDINWCHLANASSESVDARLEEQASVYAKVTTKRFKNRLGQVLEIAVYRALREQSVLGFVGGFPDLDEHGDEKLYRKEEPPSTISGKSMGEKRLDFIGWHREAGLWGMEVKNARAWFYPDRPDVRDFIWKCCTVNAVPVLIARRISYVLRSEVFEPCGVIIHQTYNQRYPRSGAELASHVRDKRLLGFHDVRVGNEPDARLVKFVHVNLPAVLPKARKKFDEHKDLLKAFGDRSLSYLDFHVALNTRRGKYDLPADAGVEHDDGEAE